MSPSTQPGHVPVANALAEVLAAPTPAAWLAAVVDDFDNFLVDHAACERKASAMAVSMICHYPDRTALLTPMADLAVEEMAHYRDVLRLIQDRGVTITRDEKDPYVNQLRACLRAPREAYFQDRLLVAGLIEARGSERFGLLAQALPEADLRRFYRRLAQSEARHHELFFDLAERYFSTEDNRRRLDELRAEEARIMCALPARAALH